MASKLVKVNLLHDQQASVEVKRAVRKVSGVTQQLLMVAVAAFALVTMIALDYFYESYKSKDAKTEVAKQEQRANELKKLAERRAELVRQKQAVDDRIAIIKQLRTEQGGPVTLLSQVNRQIPQSSLYLFIVKQTAKGLAFVGRAENEAVVQQFAHNLEYSEGAFTGTEVTVVLPAKFNSKDKLVDHVTDMMNDLDVKDIDLKKLADVSEEMRENAPKSVLFVVKSTFNQKGNQTGAPATTAAKGQVAALRE